MVSRLLSGLFAPLPSLDDVKQSDDVESFEMKVIGSKLVSEDEAALEVQVRTQAISFGWQERFSVTPAEYLAELRKSIDSLSKLNLIWPTSCIYLKKNFFDLELKLDTIETLKKVREHGFIVFIEHCISYFDFDSMMVLPCEDALSHIFTVMQMFVDKKYDLDFSNGIKQFLSSILVQSFIKKNYRVTKWLMEFNLDPNACDLITGQPILIEAAQLKDLWIVVWLINKNAEINKTIQWAQDKKPHIVDFINEQIKIKNDQTINNPSNPREIS